ncbi:HlyD family efflux transporter periplasmic adaptor subunit [Niveispirillum sp. BGYR6]|uniref:HlyD family efflux transporter periplasmic adaptor subunit n=1 Tax=Niveispirillum sp. BGYR6 TaxID=2971249 RepID=UPI0022B9AF82|nr:HlyD family efflux transporter periplasmic adaptor subunit [Niveispirillum sp. BGYR6]MDG5498014.1 HlyD family efflux transporter periplasmic adaptor subunit [Niveispirillum sp. BGYR6]
MAELLTLGNQQAPALEAAPVIRLAQLRDELILHEGPRDRDGSPSWTLEDPARGRFFRLGWMQMEMLARWDLGDPRAIAAAVNQDTPLGVTTEEVMEFARFLSATNLLKISGPDANAGLLRQLQATRMHWGKWLLKNYLFVRIPLVRPEAFLNACKNVAALFYTPAFLILTLCAGALGLLLVARQWDVFTRTFLHFFSMEGAALSGAALLSAKILHELGHALTAKRYGCRVPTMGVAFMVMWPVLYTDTSAAWTLADRRKRMTIGAAGMAAELILACYMTLLWSFLPDGPLRSATFLLATTTWIMTLAINLNPFMRFDGYFLFSDLLDVANLQDRSFALARWWLREKLFKFGEPKPEEFDPGMERILIAYAIGTWTYRFFLFMGIALLVYHFFFKLLGIFLMLVELVWFIGRPIWNEIMEWTKRRQAYHWNRNTRISAALAGLALVLFIFPWKGSIHAAGLLRAERQAQVFVPSPGRLEEILVQPGELVRERQPLFRLQSPDLVHELELAEREVAILRWQSAFHSMVNDVTTNREATWRQMEAATAKQQALQQQQQRLTITAPFDGQMVDLAHPLKAGEWLPTGDWLGTVVSPDSAQVEAYVNEADLHRLSKGAQARFHPEDPSSAAIDLTVIDIAQTTTRRLDNVAELASTHGGSIAAIPGRNGAIIPEQAIYRVLLKPSGETQIPKLTLRGKVVLEGARESMVEQIYERFVAILVRESGF